MAREREGSKRERSPGVWEVRVYRGRDPRTGKPRQASKTVHGSERDADRVLLDMLDRADVASSLNVRSVAELVDLWLEHLRDIGRAGNTVEGYEAKLRNHVLPALGKTPIEKLSALHLDRLYGAMRAAGLERSIPQVHAVVRSMLSQAVKWDLVEKNVAKQATPPTVAPVAPWAPPDETVRAFLQAVAERDADLGAYLLLTADLGARRSEPLALRWSDVDFDKAEVEVSHALEHTRTQRKAGEGPRVKDTKTHARGVIPIGGDTVEALRGVQERQRAHWVKVGVLPVKDPFVFADDKFTGDVPWRPDRVTRAVRRHRARPELAGLPEVGKVTVKSLRHFMVTSLAARGMMVEAMKRARHRSITTTQRYTAAVEARQRASADVMADVLAFKRPDEVAEASP